MRYLDKKRRVKLLKRFPLSKRAIGVISDYFFVDDIVNNPRLFLNNLRAFKLDLIQRGVSEDEISILNEKIIMGDKKVDFNSYFDKKYAPKFIRFFDLYKSNPELFDIKVHLYNNVSNMRLKEDQRRIKKLIKLISKSEIPILLELMDSINILNKYIKTFGNSVRKETKQLVDSYLVIQTRIGFNKKMAYSLESILRNEVVALNNGDLQSFRGWFERELDFIKTVKSSLPDIKISAKSLTKKESKMFQILDYAKNHKFSLVGKLVGGLLFSVIAAGIVGYTQLPDLTKKPSYFTHTDVRFDYNRETKEYTQRKIYFYKHQKVLPDVYYHMAMNIPDVALDLATGYYTKGFKALAHYLNASGRPLEFEFSDKEWDYMLVQTKNKEWKRGLDGWERVGMIEGGTNYLESDKDRSLTDAWNVLGFTTLARKPRGDGHYEYRIEETFDFIGSQSSDGVCYGREVPIWFSKVLDHLFPGVINIPEGAQYRKGGYVSIDISATFVETVGRPFKIIASTVR